jgi:hypothetical protein
MASCFNVKSVGTAPENDTTLSALEHLFRPIKKEALAMRAGPIYSPNLSPQRIVSAYPVFSLFPWVDFIRLPVAQNHPDMRKNIMLTSNSCCRW